MGFLLGTNKAILMKVLKELTEKDFKWNMDTIDAEFKAGVITREQARTSRDKITKAFKTGENNRMVAKSIDKTGSKWWMTK